MKNIFVTSIIAALAFVSCSKEKADPVSNAALLTASSWYLVRITSRANGVTEESSYNTLGSCAKDDPYDFMRDGRLIVSPGTKCNPGDPDYAHNWSWELNDNETALGFNRGYGFVYWQIVKLTKDSLVVKLANGSVFYTDYYAHTY